MSRRQSGFTLMELVVGMALTVMVMAGLAPLFIGLIGHGLRGIDLTDRQQEARWVTDMVAQDIRFARNSFATGNGWVEFEKEDSNGATVRVRYIVQANPTDPAGSQQSLTRILKSAGGAVIATSPVGNPNRGYVIPGYFTVNATTIGRVVTQVNIIYRVGRDSGDTNPVTVQTIVRPLNHIEIP